MPVSMFSTKRGRSRTKFKRQKTRYPDRAATNAIHRLTFDILYNSTATTQSWASSNSKLSIGYTPDTVSCPLIYKCVRVKTKGTTTTSGGPHLQDAVSLLG